MSQPTRAPDWATDTNFPAGSDDWSGLANKSAPSAGKIATGFVPDSDVPAEEVNDVLNNHGAWIKHLKAALGVLGFGDGSGGDVTDPTFSGGDKFYNVLTITSARANAGGRTIWARKVIFQGAGAALKAVGSDAGTAGTGSSPGIGGAANRFGGGGHGGAGEVAGGGTGAISAVDASFVILGGAGGAGGTGGNGAGHAAGTGGTAYDATLQESVHSLSAIVRGAIAGIVTGVFTTLGFFGGLGGGGGRGNSTTSDGGGGGGAGGVIVLIAEEIVLDNTGFVKLDASGGSGANPSGVGNSGGGGGGGGGAIFVIARRIVDGSGAPVTLLTNVSGNNGAAGAGGGGSGANGTNGRSIVVVLDA